MEIREFQRLIQRTYGNRDRQRGLWSSFGWLVEEIGELSRALRDRDPRRLSSEVADAVAWLFSVADMAGVDVQDALRKYENGCPKCGKIPCECPDRDGRGPSRPG